jgi:DNA mismatch repair protein MutL
MRAACYPRGAAADAGTRSLALGFVLGLHLPPVPIRRLDPLVVNQIAAGEVVDRPASVVRELVENALDAGATRIEVAIEGGGRELIRVSDDGCGIPADELPLAIASHATSKIESVDDLERIATMGFRGEALASIASVARLRLVSRPREAVAASALEAEGGEVGRPQPAAGPPGTTVTVRTLFHNVPARRKFLRGEASEAARVVETVESLAIAHPSVSFTVRSGEEGGRTLLDLPATADLRRRVLDCLGRELEPAMLEASSDDATVSIWGLVGKPELARPNSRHLRIHVNGRPISDRALVHAVREAYRGLVEPGRTPVAAIFLELDPAEVDLNVHPQKSEVRFRSPAAVHQAVRRSVRAALGGEDLVPEWTAPAVGGSSASSWSRPAAGPAGVTLEPRGPVAIPGPRPDTTWSELLETARGESPAPESLPLPVERLRILQVDDAYVVAADRDGLVIVDQHALHERVMFERLLARMAAGDLPSQRLLSPAIVEASPLEIAALPRIEALCRRIGLELAPAGPRSVAVHAFPVLLFERKVDPAEFARELLAKAADEERDLATPTGLEAALAETLDMMACKAAVKAGDRLSELELAEILRLRDETERGTNCPHGRPTSVRITRAELDRRFGR